MGHHAAPRLPQEQAHALHHTALHGIPQRRRPCRGQDQRRHGAVAGWTRAGLACATGWAQGACVTALVSGAQFARPILVGDLVEVQARLAYTRTTSMGIAVEVYRCALPGEPLQQVLQLRDGVRGGGRRGPPAPVDTWNPRRPATWRWPSRCAPTSTPRALPDVPPHAPSSRAMGAVDLFSARPWW